MALPNLIVIGAMKSGTSSLHAYLNRHPDVSMSTPKEPNFFNDHPYGTWRRGVDWYSSHWPGPTAVRGESSTNYTKLPRMPGVAARMHSVVPDARLVYLLRDPIERIPSQWLHQVLAGRERRPLAEAVTQPVDNQYVVVSRYHDQLSEYLPRYGMERILVLDLDDLARDPATVMRRVFAFLGVDDSFSSPTFQRRYHESKLKACPTWLGHHLKRVLPGRAWNEVKRFPPARRALFKPPPSNELPGTVRDQLAEALADDVARLRSATGLPFAGWSL